LREHTVHGRSAGATKARTTAPFTNGAGSYLFDPPFVELPTTTLAEAVNKIEKEPNQEPMLADFRPPPAVLGDKLCRSEPIRRRQATALASLTQISGGRPASVIVVVEAAGDDGDHVMLDVIDQPVLLGYPA
jgi:hypothetical protein